MHIVLAIMKEKQICIQMREMLVCLTQHNPKIYQFHTYMLKNVGRETMKGLFMMMKLFCLIRGGNFVCVRKML